MKQNNERSRATLLPLMTLAIIPAFSHAESVPAENANTSRIDRLLQEMTLEEKMGLIRGGMEDAGVYQGQAGYLPGVPRLNIPSLRMADGPPGVLTRVPAQAQTATMGVAATFDVKDAEANGIAIGRDARALGIDVILQPFINIDRDITTARGYNTFGEDPFLTAQMGAAEIRGAQAQGVMSQAKHYVGYDSNSFNIQVDQQTLHEVYVAPFEAAVKAGVSSIMCSYNRINGVFACGNDSTLKVILKQELGFKGFVTSDWGAMHSVQFINHGVDMEMPGPAGADSPFAGFMHSYFSTTPPAAAPAKPIDLSALDAMFGGVIPEEPPATSAGDFAIDTDGSDMGSALKDGSVTEAAITAAARRVLYQIDRFGYLDGKQKHNVTPASVEVNAAIIRKTSDDAAVLLKNTGSALPLATADLRSLALIGPGAGQVAAIGTFGERSPGLPERQVGPLAALRKLASGARIAYAVDDDMTGVPVPAALLSHDGKPGLERTVNSSITVDRNLDFTHSNGRALPADGNPRWRGTLKVSAEGNYWFYLQVLGARASLSIDGKPVGRTGALKGAVHGDIQHASQDGVFPTVDGLDNVRRAVQLSAGSHSIEVTATGDTSGQQEQVRLNWLTPLQRVKNHAAAIATAKSAHAAVVFAWTRGKPDFALPGDQDQLIADIAAVNSRTIVVLNTSQPVAMPWLDKVQGVVQMWWPGDEGGWSTADVLLGKVNPAGRLPFTWAKRIEDYPATDPAHPERSAKGVDGKTTFSEGVNVGYRWFDKQNIEPLFAFGYGLSYTSFEYSALRVTKTAEGGLDVTVHLKNTGKVAGDEVPQVYLGAPTQQPSDAQFATRTLAAFTRVRLAAGASQDVVLHVNSRSLEYWSIADQKWNRADARQVSVGSSSRDLRLSTERPL